MLAKTLEVNFKLNGILFTFYKIFLLVTKYFIYTFVKHFNYKTEKNNFRATTFDASKTTRIIVHGYIQNGDTAWLNEMSETHLAVSLHWKKIN